MTPPTAMLAKDTRGDLTVVPHGWVLEPKLDGWRWLTSIDEDTVTGYGRTGKPKPLPAWMEDWWTLLPGGTVLDGELVCDDLQKAPVVSTRLARGGIGLRYVVFDVLQIGGFDIRGRPWHERRALLSKAAAKLPQEYVMVSPVQLYDGDSTWHDSLVAQGFEGTVAKDPSGVYEPGARRWLKIKPQTTMDAVVTGWKFGAGKSNSTQVGALHIKLANGTLTTCAWAGTPEDAEKLIGADIEIRHHGEFESGSVRHPIFWRTREDLA